MNNMDKSFACSRTHRFATKVTHNPAISCSDDTQVAICTEDGVYILMIPCDQIYPSDNIALQTSKIAPCSKVKTFDVDTPRLKVERALSKTDGHQLMLDRTISPQVQSNQVITGFRAAAWSPQGADRLGRCVIASLSCDHRLCIYESRQDGQDWNKLVELSELFYEHVKQEGFHLADVRIAQANNEQGSLMEEMKWRTYCLAAIAVSWSPVFIADSKHKMMDRKKESPADEGSTFALLAVAMKSGHVVVWKVSFPVTPESCHIDHVLDTGSDVPTSLGWARLSDHTAVLAVGSLSGQLKLFLITTRQTSDHNTEQNSDHNTEQTSDHNTEQTSDHDIPVVKKRRKAKVGTTHQDSCTKDREETIAEDPVEEDREETTGPSHKDTSSEFSVTEVCPLWSERDKVTITHLCWSTEHNLMFASKGPFLLTFHIALDTGSSHAPVNPVKVKVKPLPSMLIGDKLGVSALWLDGSKLFVSLTSGPVHCVQLGQESSLTVDRVDVQHETGENKRQVDTDAWRSHGLCGTPGRVFLCLLESPAIDYCHLTIIQPLKLTLVVRADTDAASVLLSQEESLIKCVDALAQVKFIIAQKEPLPKSLAQLIKQKSAWPKLPTVRLKLVRFLLQVMRLSDDESEVKLEDIREVETLIVKSHLETALMRLVEMEVKPTTDAEKKSLMQACDWLRTCHENSKGHDLHLTQKVMTLLKQVKAVTDTKEKCEICQAYVAFTSFRQEQCPNGHLFGRCCQTLLLCHHVPYRTCASCEALAVGRHVTGSSWFEDLKTNRCTFCDGLLL